MTVVMSVNARTGEAHALDVHDAGAAEVDAVVARAGDVAPMLSSQSPSERARMLRALAASVDDYGEALVAAADRETALGVDRLTGEVARTSGQFRLFAEVVEDGQCWQARIDRGDQAVPEIRSVLQPVGTVAVFGASNFPLAFSVPGGDTASALAAGCPVVAKAHPAHPESSEVAVEALRAGLAACGVPTSAVGLVHGLDAGRFLVQSSGIHAVGFTGSERVGRLLFDLVSQRPNPIPFFGELGSVNPVVVMADVDPSAFGEGLAASMTLGAGQFCTKPGLVFLPSHLVNEVGSSLMDALEGTGSFTMLTTEIAQSYESRLDDLDSAIDVWRGPAPGVTATVLTVDAVDLDRHPELRHECFGPTTVLATYSSEAELLDQIGKLPGSLTATVHGVDPAAASEVIEQLQAAAGRIVWNGFPTGVRVAWATHHGGPYPASTSSQHTSVGASALARWLRPVAYQDLPDTLLPPSLRDGNPWGLPRRVDGTLV